MKSDVSVYKPRLLALVLMGLFLLMTLFIIDLYVISAMSKMPVENIFKRSYDMLLIIPVVALIAHFSESVQLSSACIILKKLGSEREKIQYREIQDIYLSTHLGYSILVVKSKNSFFRRSSLLYPVQRMYQEALSRGAQVKKLPDTE